MDKRNFTGTHDLLKAEIGDEFDPYEITITEAMVERSAWANDDYNPWYMEDSPFGGRIASPTFLTGVLDRILWSYYAFPHGGALHAQQQIEFIKPIKVGKKIKITGSMVDRYHKRGRDWFVHEYLAFDEDGVKVARMERVEVIPIII